MSDSTGTATGPGGPGDDPRADADAEQLSTGPAPGRSGSARLEGDDLLAAGGPQDADARYDDEPANGDAVGRDDGPDGPRRPRDVDDDDLSDDPDDPDDADVDAADAVPAGALAGAGAARTASRTRSTSPVGTATREPRQGRIRNIGTFYRQVVAELRKVIWPTRRELLTYTSVVLVFVIVMVTIVALLDFAFGRAVLAVFGDS